ncbi:glycosyl hydrolase [Pontibacter roseus]|uniref:glycosyl hydrolase n=1 Tax=Pontibacter roseus TaxID=336989 RepID=UPI0012FC1716|nr:glycosyl hydrolase [Pontibacter roseus]
MLPTAPRMISEGYSGPIVITKGGTYTGNWESRNSEVPAVEIRTSQPVIITHSRIRGAGPLIRSTGLAADITVRHTSGYGITPTAWQDYEKPRRFLGVDVFRNIVVENCYMESTAGIYLGKRYDGNGSPEQTIKIRYNKARNIDGRIFGGQATAQFVQFNFRNEVPHAEIAWNEIINEPDKSAVEDNINIYNSRGTAASPILVHNNYLQGAYPLPATSAQYTGGGILTDSPDPDSSNVTAHVRIYDNHLVGLGNYCIGIAGGNHVEVYNNRAIVSGMIDEQTPFKCWTSGIWAKDFYNTGHTYNNSFRGNMLGVVGQNGSWRNEVMQGMEAAAQLSDNKVLPGEVTLAREQEELLLWHEKLRKNNLTLGPASESAQL